MQIPRFDDSEYEALWWQLERNKNKAKAKAKANAANDQGQASASASPSSPSSPSPPIAAPPATTTATGPVRAPVPPAAAAGTAAGGHTRRPWVKSPPPTPPGGIPKEKNPLSADCLEGQAFPPPPSHWILFDPAGPPLRVQPPQPIAETALLRPDSQLQREKLFPRPFGKRRCLEAPSARAQPEEKADRIANLDAEDMCAEAVRIHRLFRGVGLNLLDCLVTKPTDFEKHSRQWGTIAENLVEVLHKLRENEVRALIVQRQRQSVSDRKLLLEELRAAIPGVEQRLNEFKATANASQT
mmetsp:Transcript_36641/g.77883  ORF Transcript_36641/g.77883 Transcript_36641/m.77883 type:complete len:298 (+) Transcript_36641:37-930(+)